MKKSELSRTSPTLLSRAGLGDEVAWVQLLDIYHPLLTKWAKQSKATEADVDDAVGEVLAILVRTLANFEYDPKQSFRGYLRTMLRNELGRLAKKKPSAQDDSRLDGLLIDENSKTELIDLLIEQEEKLRVPAILLVARQRVQKDSTWTSWELTTLEELPAKDVAKSLGIDVASVYVNRSRVFKMIEEIGRELRQEDAS